MSRPRNRRPDWPGSPNEQNRDRAYQRYVVRHAQDPAAPNRVVVLDRRTGKSVDSFRSAEQAQARAAALNETRLSKRLAKLRATWQRPAYRGHRFVVRKEAGAELRWVLVDKSTGAPRRSYADPNLADKAARRLNSRRP